MQLTPRRHELLSVYMLGIGTLFLYLGYITQLFIAESVIHIVSARYPGVISPFAGYYGQAFHYSAFAISSLFTPSIQHYVASKWILVIASVLFAVYYLGFFHLNDVYFYLSQTSMGIGYSFYNNGEGAYLSEHSSRRTLESNTGIETAVGHSSIFAGGVALMAIFYFTPMNSSANAEVIHTFTDPQILLIYGIFFILNVISIVIFALLPTKQYDSIASNSPTILPNFKQQLSQFGTSLINVNTLLLVPFFCYMGLIVSFVVGVYPTTLTFTSTFITDIYIIAVYSMAMGAAEIFGGIVLRRLLKRIKDWSLVISISMHFMATSTMLLLIYFSVPENATIEPTSASSLLIKPSRLLVVFIGFLSGLGDFTITTCRAVICQIAVPNARMQVFSISRLYQCIAAGIVLFLTRFMNITSWIIVLAVGLTVSTITFGVVARRNTHQCASTVSPVNNEKLTTAEMA
ncbi:hypothetical protein KIN20_026298 [Parelaphostrongylus tenuis]|uniref:Uncharacterized protein n=1 Tax=Parelaphostrongylus tenuis TaxID=148309 RepID=A0AAD5NDP9_PARTN|nr:hypothetical protein KIN20_026298 [Parelaphostrongylus tenuis]